MTLDSVSAVQEALGRERYLAARPTHRAVLKASLPH